MKAAVSSIVRFHGFLKKASVFAVLLMEVWRTRGHPTISMNLRFFGNETILRSATHCNFLPAPAPGLETLSNIHLTQALLFLSLALTLALVLAGDLEKIF
jgi:hypothetical protein